MQKRKMAIGESGLKNYFTVKKKRKGDESAQNVEAPHKAPFLTPSKYRTDNIDQAAETPSGRRLPLITSVKVSVPLKKGNPVEQRYEIPLYGHLRRLNYQPGSATYLEKADSPLLSTYKPRKRNKVSPITAQRIISQSGQERFSNQDQVMGVSAQAHAESAVSGVPELIDRVKREKFCYQWGHLIFESAGGTGKSNLAAINAECNRNMGVIENVLRTLCKEKWLDFFIMEVEADLMPDTRFSKPDTEDLKILYAHVASNIRMKITGPGGKNIIIELNDPIFGGALPEGAYQCFESLFKKYLCPSDRPIQRSVTSFFKPAPKPSWMINEAQEVPRISPVQIEAEENEDESPSSEAEVQVLQEFVSVDGRSPIPHVSEAVGSTSLSSISVPGETDEQEVVFREPGLKLRRSPVDSEENQPDPIKKLSFPDDPVEKSEGEENRSLHVEPPEGGSYSPTYSK